jgi:catalase (peroxidase I)
MRPQGNYCEAAMSARHTSGSYRRPDARGGVTKGRDVHSLGDRLWLSATWWS